MHESQAACVLCRDLRRPPHIEILAHPECRTEVLDLADQLPSTSGMIRHASTSRTTEFLLVTEDGLSDRPLLEVPGKRFHAPCKPSTSR